jgi:AhpD family alkylhydroperoxidase
LENFRKDGEIHAWRNRNLRSKAMLPKTLRYWLFDTLSVQTMRYVSAVPTREAEGLTKQVYDMIKDDFFKNGSLTSRSKVPELMAAIWTGGRESMLVADQVDRTTKDAISAVLSQENDCPYCEDMLVSLVHAGGEHKAAGDIFAQNGLDATDETLRKRLEWVRAIATPDLNDIPATPFTDEQVPEVLGTLMGMSDINRFSHVVMEDSPVAVPLGLRTIKAFALRLFGNELEATRRIRLEPGRALPLLPAAPLPEDMAWAIPNPRVADALARWTATVEREAVSAISPLVRAVVASALDAWNGEQMPISRSWVNAELEGLDGEERAIAGLAIVLAKAPYQVDTKMADAVLKAAQDEAHFIRILAWASFTGARRFTQLVAERIRADRLGQVPLPSNPVTLLAPAMVA